MNETPLLRLRPALLLAACLLVRPAALRAAVVEAGALAPAMGMIRTVPQFRTSVLSQISLIDGLSAAPSPTLAPLLSAAPSAADPWRAEAARFVGALAAQPRVLAAHAGELSATVGAAGAGRLQAAAANLERSAARDPALRAQLDGLRSRLDFDDPHAVSEWGGRLDALFDGSVSRAGDAAAGVHAPAASPGSARLPADWTLRPSALATAARKIPTDEGGIADVRREKPASRVRRWWAALPAALFSGTAFAGFGSVSDFTLPDAVPWVGALLAGLALWGSIRGGRTRRLYSDLPTSKTAGVFMGLVELKGTAEAEKPLATYLASERAVYHTWMVEEHWSRTETYTDKDGKLQTRTETGWQTVASGGKSVPFYLKDDTGIVLVRPDHAKVEPRTVFSREVSEGDPLYYGKGPSGSVSGSTGDRRFTEEAIVLHDSLYVVGPARERADMIAPEIASDGKAESFLISTRSEEAVLSGLRGQFWGLGILGAALSWAGFAVQRFMVDPDLGWQAILTTPLGLMAAGVFAGVWAAANAVMMYNSMVALRNRVEQAWSNIDVQLKRRADLIPNLVATVTALRDHESRVQESLAALRSQAEATRPGLAGPDPAAVSGQVRAIAESYPELKSGKAFLDLMKSISDTEERIALARTYFNDIATSENIRLEIVPDRFLARLMGLRPQTLFQASGFERKVPEVSLAE